MPQPTTTETDEVTCPVCGVGAEYVRQGDRGAWWVHKDTFQFMSKTPRLHDVNTSMRQQGATQ